MIRTAIIVAAGKGTRLINHYKPKGFLNLGNHYLIEYSINALKKWGIEEIRIVTGYKSEYYKTLSDKYKEIKLFHNSNFEIGGSLQTLLYGLEGLNEGCLVLDSDILYQDWCIEKLATNPNPNVILTGSSSNMHDEIYVETTSEDVVTSITKEKDKVLDSSKVVVGITKISFDIYEDLRNYSNRIDNPSRQDHHDYAFLNIPHKFHLEHLPNLVFAEIDDEAQLTNAITKVLPKLDLI